MQKKKEQDVRNGIENALREMYKDYLKDGRITSIRKYQKFTSPVFVKMFVKIHLLKWNEKKQCYTWEGTDNPSLVAMTNKVLRVYSLEKASKAKHRVEERVRNVLKANGVNEKITPSIINDIIKIFPFKYYKM